MDLFHLLLKSIFNYFLTVKNSWNVDKVPNNFFMTISADIYSLILAGAL